MNRTQAVANPQFKIQRARKARKYRNQSRKQLLRQPQSRRSSPDRFNNPFYEDLNSQAINTEVDDFGPWVELAHRKDSRTKEFHIKLEVPLKDKSKMAVSSTFSNSTSEDSLKQDKSEIKVKSNSPKDEIQPLSATPTKTEKAETICLKARMLHPLFQNSTNLNDTIIFDMPIVKHEFPTLRRQGYSRRVEKLHQMKFLSSEVLKAMQKKEDEKQKHQKMPSETRCRAKTVQNFSNSFINTCYSKREKVGEVVSTFFNKKECITRTNNPQTPSLFQNKTDIMKILKEDLQMVRPIPKRMTKFTSIFANKKY